MTKLQRSLYWIAFLFGLTLPFSTKAGNVFLIAFYITLLLLVLFGHKKYERSNFRILKYSTLLLFIPALLSLIYANDIPNAFNVAGKRISYLVTPVFFLFLNKNDISEIRKLSLNGLTWGVLLSSLFLISNNFYEYYQIKPLWTFDKDLFNYYHTNKNYTDTLAMHPTYYGMYALLALNSLLTKRISNFKFIKWVAIFVLTVSVLFISSRIILVLYFLTIFYYLYKYLLLKVKNRRKVFYMLSLIIVMGSLVLVSVFKSTYFYQRITQELFWDLSYEVGTNYNTVGKGDSRLARWEIAIGCILQKPIWGYGAGNESKILVKQYLDNDMTSAAKNEYNAHNQYLGFALEGGFVGLILMCYFIITNMKFATGNKDLMSILFFVYLLLVCVFENYLIRNAAIIYVAFFGTIFLYNHRLSR